MAQAAAAHAQADLSNTQALIAHLKLEIEKLRRTMYGPRAERQARLIDQLELQLEELEAAATEDELAAEAAAQKTQAVRSLKRKRPVRKPFPDDIWRERVVIAAPTHCPCCGSTRLSKLGEDITETLEVIRASMEGDRNGAREGLVPGLRDDRATAGAVPCDAAQHRAAASGDDPVRQVRPAHPVEPPGQRFQCEGIDLSVSTLADQVGAGVFAACRFIV